MEQQIFLPTEIDRKPTRSNLITYQKKKKYWNSNILYLPYLYEFSKFWLGNNFKYTTSIVLAYKEAQPAAQKKLPNIKSPKLGRLYNNNQIWQEQNW